MGFIALSACLPLMLMNLKLYSYYMYYIYNTYFQICHHVIVLVNTPWGSAIIWAACDYAGWPSGCSSHPSDSCSTCSIRRRVCWRSVFQQSGLIRLVKHLSCQACTNAKAKTLESLFEEPHKCTLMKYPSRGWLAMCTPRARICKQPGVESG